ncbi:hypothetical protein TREMEDRAFT_33043 [Tremella mesenterica DSM 1558]|uniref:uncharacterized protein n=1 Tax=Tremella mesenterica (strain ATCC 24925 / CBS 8224 / DSM 1558 / NBRC 9311 / NRRL Y-6157 / RJB 2259-6 / UBC 559-6) TaxID=578456 RepID=UPI0003F499B6|nr:uncharacterized protein TREMEDRAFT_33043 [Tremella mesenterica DSM 1558]EIW68152.1 hypothetical protein TREMEDRAFT_33043 [Tremella mesenterica DSM 1558]
MFSRKQEPRCKRVLVVGAGAAGMACADSLSLHPDKFKVTLIDAQGYCGGQAFSIPLPKSGPGSNAGAEWMNQGVQGGSHIYSHTFYQFRKFGYEAEPVDLQVSFGKGDKFWSNLFPTNLVASHAKDIARFESAVKWFRRLEVIWAVVPIKISLKLWGLSEQFINYMIYPSLALFLGTGNATPDLPTIMLERLYTSPTYGMWYPIDNKSLSSNLPPMVVFPETSAFYSKWQKTLEDRGVRVKLNTELTTVLTRKPTVQVLLRPRRQQKDFHNPNDADEDLVPVREEFDEIVLCVLSDTAKRVLGKQATWFERWVLGNARWSDDITVTHTDSEYIRKHYTVEFDESQAVEQLGGRDESSRIRKGRNEFQPMYMIAQEKDPRKLEMCFDCSAFQYQLDKHRPFEDHVFQTIFLDKNNAHLWTKEEISKDKIIREDWWHQLCHSWTHYVSVVPFIGFLNRNKSHTTYAGSWTLVNAHEVAIISGMAAAYKLGADYPKELREDTIGRRAMAAYLMLAHGLRLRGVV